MDTLINRGFGLLNRATAPAAAELVRYIRAAAVLSDAIEATLSNQQIEQLSAGGTTVIGRQFTWRIKAADLVVDGVVDKPRTNDRIEWSRGGFVYVFSVQPELGAPSAGSVDPRSAWLPASAKLIEVQQP